MAESVSLMFKQKKQGVIKVKSFLTDQECRDIYVEAMKNAPERRQLQLVRSIEAKILERMERRNREKNCEQNE